MLPVSVRSSWYTVTDIKRLLTFRYWNFILVNQYLAINRLAINQFRCQTFELNLLYSKKLKISEVNWG